MTTLRERLERARETVAGVAANARSISPDAKRRLAFAAEDIAEALHQILTLDERISAASKMLDAALEQGSEAVPLLVEMGKRFGIGFGLKIGQQYQVAQMLSDEVIKAEVNRRGFNRVGGGSITGRITSFNADLQSGIYEVLTPQPAPPREPSERFRDSLGRVVDTALPFIPREELARMEAAGIRAPQRNANDLRDAIAFSAVGVVPKDNKP